MTFSVFLQIVSRIVCLVLFGMLALGQIGRISFSGQEVNGYYYEIVAGVLFALLVIQHKLKPLRIILKYKLKAVPALFLYMFFSFFLTSFYYPFSSNAVAFFYVVRITFYTLLSFYVWFHLKTEPKFLKTHTLAITGFIFATIGISLLQYVFFPNLEAWSTGGWDIHLNRAFGVFLEPSVLGAVFGLAIGYLLLSPLPSYIRYSGIALSSAGILLTFSRGTYVAFLIAGFYYLVKLRKIKFIVLVIGIFIIGLFIVPKPTGEGVNLFRVSTIQSRFVDYKESLAIFSQHFLIGIGYNHVRDSKPYANEIGTSNIVSHAGSAFHSSFLTILVTTGVLGFLLFIVSLGEIAKTSFFASLAVIFLSCLSVTDNILLHPFVLFLFLQLIIRPYGKLR
ncbi:O-antigen ligase family protein [Candidatus Roizmanbacteria bacterium]|nr:O-antigen ligase family protein [Candidatus Roizmanbacteria bacterium]